MHPSVQAFFDHATNTVSYLVHDPDTKKAAIIDPVLDFTPRNGRIATTSADALLTAAAGQGLDIIYVLETHAHADHLSAAHHLREVTGAPIVIGAQITEVQKIFGALLEADDVTHDGAAFDHLLQDGDMLQLGNLTIHALHTPGHTPACVTYVIGDAAFVGDTMFMPDYGTARADFPGGSAHMLYGSIRKILDLPPETRIFVGHDYLPEGRSEFAWETTVADQRADNVHMHDGISEGEFIAMRTARDKSLDAPQLILPSLQVNIRAGAFPPASPGGMSILDCR
jgi:glyoxylase-like metal-dependent hydrolase (beta-lactamase superfamily II)